MNSIEKVELTLIALFAIMIWFITPLLPNDMKLPNLVLFFSSLLLLQSLMRDVSILFLRRNNKSGVAEKRVVRCICIESVVGATGVFLGLCILVLGISFNILMSQIQWTLCVILVTVTGFLIKDLVLQWNPWKIYKEKDHLNIIFSWKKQDI